MALVGRLSTQSHVPSRPPWDRRTLGMPGLWLPEVRASRRSYVGSEASLRAGPRTMPGLPSEKRAQLTGICTPCWLRSRLRGVPRAPVACNLGILVGSHLSQQGAVCLAPRSWCSVNTEREQTRVHLVLCGLPSGSPSPADEAALRVRKRDPAPLLSRASVCRQCAVW